METGLADTPAVPTGLDIHLINPTTLAISCAAQNDAAGYNIYRCGTQYGIYIKLNTSALCTPCYSDTIAAADSYLYHYKFQAVNENGESPLSDPISREAKLFGPNVYFFSPSDDPATVQNICGDIFTRQETAQFGSGRYALLFKKGTYSSTINFKIGFYTQVAGLGKTPADTTLQKLTVDAKWRSQPGGGGSNATCNFWRSLENLTLNSDTTWAVSQAAPVRRVQVNGNITFDDQGGWASGGYLADSVVTGQTGSITQQQWFTRNSLLGSWSGGQWNMVFVGVQGSIPDQVGTLFPYNVTKVVQAPAVAEKTFLYFDDVAGDYCVFVPGFRRNAAGVSWSQNDMGIGSSVSIDNFFVAKPGDTADVINAALASGQSLLLTPGTYRLDKAIQVSNPNTVVLGLGLATLVPDNGNTVLNVNATEGVRIAGILFDAGKNGSQRLMQVGMPGVQTGSADNPIVLSDLFFRVGGNGPAAAKICLEVNSNYVIGDDFWLWRADHGAGAGWYSNPADTGLVVNGDNMTMYCLMCEHFQKYETLWNGNGGKMYFFQNEFPYDVVKQSEWMSHDGTVNGYSAYKVADNVTSHEAWGLGCYNVFINVEEYIDVHSAIEVPDANGVKVHNACTLCLTGGKMPKGSITHIINEVGDSVGSKTGFARKYVIEY